MKNIALLSIFLLLLGSCVSVPMGKKPDKNPKPFVKLKTGEKIEATKVLIGNKIKADDVKYKRKTLTAFCDGEKTYVRCNKKSFATKIFEGDINVYRTLHTSTSTSYGYGGGMSGGGMHTSTRTSIKYYIEQSNNGKLNYLDYKSAKRVILPRDPGFVYLAAYKRNRTIDRIVSYGGLGLMAGGTVIAGRSLTSSAESNMGEAAGVGMIFMGLSAIFTGAIMSGVNHMNIYKSVARHNGIKDLD